MSELRHILRYTDENSLILGDELCSGTEIESAIEVFLLRVFNYFIQSSRKVLFLQLIFTKSLVMMKLQVLKNLALKHMTVRYDRERENIYDRKLNDSSGDSVYVGS